MQNQAKKGNLSNEWTEKVREATDLVDLVSEYLTLKKKGKNFLGLCPFHQEKTPSFSVSPEKGVYHCFGCGKGGDVFNFVMEVEHLSFPETLRYLARKANITLPEKRDKKELDYYERLYLAVSTAQEYFRESLMDEKTAAEGWAYLNRRGVIREMIDTFQIGYAPMSWEGVIEFGRKKGVTMDSLAIAGLAVKKDSMLRIPTGTGYYDRFRRRFTFPIQNISGRIVAFGGRAVNPKDQPKYLNCPETPVYKKGKELFGLAVTKEEIRKSKTAVLVEGYIDLISLYQRGILNVAAALGTAFTAEQAILLARFAENVIIIFDRDAAGESAVFRAVENLYDAGLNVQVVQLPPGDDPDSFIRDHGKEGFDQLIQQSLSYLEFQKKRIGGALRVLPPSEQEKVLLELAGISNRMRDDARSLLFLEDAARTLDFDFRLMERYSKRLRKASAPAAEKAQLAAPSDLEGDFLALLISKPELLAGSSGDWLEYFSKPDSFSLFETLLERHVQGLKIGFDVLMNELPEDKFHSYLLVLSQRDLGEADPKQLLTDYVNKLADRKKNQRVQELKQLLMQAEKSADETRARELVSELDKIIR
ncbi:MAG: DNA primase [candidate division Zixibacteria bacterium]|nr:DNA primase [candidate division Zixibacteria bacterium]MCI0595090.1 DNA primase [candidate division Zixibacteria bacterium]